MRMIDVSQDIESLTSFKRDSDRLMKQMRRTGRPVVLTINGKAQAVVMDPRVYQAMADRISAMDSIARGLAQAKQGLGLPLEEAFALLESDD